MKSRNFITLANDLNNLTLPAKQDTLIQLCNLLAQYECIRNKIFKESDTLDPSFIMYVQTPMNIDVDAVRVLSLFLAEHRIERVEQGKYNPKTRIANIFKTMPNMSLRSAHPTLFHDVYWFKSAEEAGVVFFSIYNSDSKENNLVSDPKAEATRAIYSFLPQIQKKLQYLIDTLGILHNVAESIEKEKQIKISEIVAAESVRELRDFQLIKKMIKIHYLLHSYVKAECRFRFLQASEVLQVASAAALSEGTINSDVVNACKNQSMKMEQVLDLLYSTENDEKKLFYSITHNDQYIPIAEIESRLYQYVQSIITTCDKAVSLCAREIRLPDSKVWPHQLTYQASRCTEAIQSFMNIISQIGYVKEELVGGATGPCTTIRNLTWLGASHSMADCKEKIISLATEASGAGILFLTKSNQWKCVHMKEVDMQTIAPRWLGGKKDPEDSTWFDTAIRECNEETFFLAKGFGNKTELENNILQLALTMPERFFVAETRNKEVYGDKPPYILLIVNMTNTFLEKRILQFVSEYSVTKLPPNLPDFYLEQGCFQIMSIEELPPNLSIVLNPLLPRIQSYTNFSSKKSIQTKSVFHSVIKKNKRYLQIPTLLGGMALSLIVPLLLDQTVPIGLIDAPAELHAEALAQGTSIGYITADGQRHLTGGSNPSIWYEQIASDDIYIPL